MLPLQPSSVLNELRMEWESVVSIFLGICLSAACGFRVFVPFLVMSVACQAGYLTLSPEFQWIGSRYAMLAFASATVLEVLAFYVPWFDNLLDLVTGPMAVLAGVAASASVLVDLPPLVRWVMAAVLGGGAAGLMQGSTSLLRGISSALTGGVGNTFVATFELIGSAATSLLGLVVPMVGILLVLIVSFIVGIALIRTWRRKRTGSPPLTTQ